MPRIGIVGTVTPQRGKRMADEPIAEQLMGGGPVGVGIAIDDPRTVVADVERAEELEFDLVGCGEHLFFHGPTPNAFAMLAAAAGATRTIRLVSSITLLPLYPAALAAKMAASLDRVS